MGERSYQQYCGLAAALDVVGERWALLIVRDLEPGPRRFTDLFRGLRGIATDILAARLRSLEAAGVVRQRQLRHPAPAKVYELTERGRELATIVGSLARWGAPLLPTPPTDDMRFHPRWALQSMVLAYTAGLASGRYALTIDDDDYTISVEGASAELSYGPPTTTPAVWIRCTADSFFALVTRGSLEDVEIEVGSPRLVRELLRSLPLLVGRGEGAAPPGARRRTPPARSVPQRS